MKRDEMNMRDVVGLFLTVAFIGAVVALFWKSIPTENEQLLSYMLGQLSGFVAGVVAYHYITKAGEKELDEQRTANTGKALDVIAAAQAGHPAGTPDDPISVAGTVDPAAPPVTTREEPTP